VVKQANRLSKDYFIVFVTTSLLMQRQKNRNEEHAHGRGDDGKRHAHLHEIAKLYCPGPTTSVFTGEEIGVTKAADAASATIIANG
jgi:hypothetical protein